MTERYTVKQVGDALRASAGVRSIAAKKLGCAPTTVSEYIKRHEDLEDLTEEIVQGTIDLAEASLIKHIGDGNLTAIIFYLKTKGRDRGYAERYEMSGIKGGPINLMTFSDLVSANANKPKITKAG